MTGDGMKIVIVDGQGGKLGRLLVEQVKKLCPEQPVYAIGTNSAATAAMLRGGADFGATGENSVSRAVMDADVVLGPMGIVVAHALLGEVTPAMAEAIGGCRARKLVIPINTCGVQVAGVQDLPLADCAMQIARQVRAMLDKEELTTCAES